jgi:hypothetical protein
VLLDASPDGSARRFEKLAPAQVLRGFGGGCYLTYHIPVGDDGGGDGSVRLRVAHIGGDPGGEDAVVSALFFDPVVVPASAGALLLTDEGGV